MPPQPPPKLLWRTYPLPPKKIMWSFPTNSTLVWKATFLLFCNTSPKRNWTCRTRCSFPFRVWPGFLFLENGGSSDPPPNDYEVGKWFFAIKLWEGGPLSKANATKQNYVFMCFLICAPDPHPKLLWRAPLSQTIMEFQNVGSKDAFGDKVDEATWCHG